MTDRQLAAWRDSGETFRYRGHDIFYRDEGAGEVLLCVHGFPTASWDWRRLWPALAARFRVLAPDMIGFGFSAKPRDYAYSIMDQATLHEALLAELGVSSVHVLAHDYGDTVVQELLARLDEQAQPALSVRSVCFLNGGLFPEAQDVRRIQKLLLTPLGPLVGRLLNRERFAASFRPIFGPQTQPTETELDAFWQLVAWNDGPRIAHRIIRYLDERRAYRDRWVGALQQTAAPLRFIVGAADPVSGLPMAARYRELVPHPDVVVLEGVGHYPQVEAPEATVEHFFAFVERVGQVSNLTTATDNVRR